MDFKNIDLDYIVHHIQFMEKLYDVVRVVNPTKKTVSTYNKSTFSTLNMSCYDFWERGKLCENCISTRAFIEKDTFVKIEYKKDRVFMITAIPIDSKDGTVILELLKDITNKGIVNDLESNNKDEIYSMISRTNQSLVQDELTKVYNRRFINERMDYEILNSFMNKRHLSIIIADIDFFKKVNDTYGHLAGDYVLKEFAQKLNEFTRKKEDWVARYGGEEFLICLNDADKETAYQIGERMRKGIENLDLNYKGQNIKITSSFGICTVFNEELTPEDLIDCADKNLYKAKKQGRNQVVGCT
jgi:diguanylate cyclase (GGDEF)-like protein